MTVSSSSSSSSAVAIRELVREVLPYPLPSGNPYYLMIPVIEEFAPSGLATLRPVGVDDDTFLGAPLED
jgi:hypothetical protein